ncbi:hypothetical protein ACP6PL_19820, partial [Dapis sp. BLCC M126]|uniref:hypothetical protein n=1 Tax=Dapis sp. BLCC M126 TaxID=3400189 RepID=UPI003CFB074E
LPFCSPSSKILISQNLSNSRMLSLEQRLNRQNHVLFSLEKSRSTILLTSLKNPNFSKFI